MKHYFILAMLLVLGACSTVHEGLTYLQAGQSFCSAGKLYIHNSDGTSRQVFDATSEAVPCL